MGWGVTFTLPIPEVAGVALTRIKELEDMLKQVSDGWIESGYQDNEWVTSINNLLD